MLNVEVLVYIYLLISTSMIIFNFVFLYYKKNKNRKIDKQSEIFKKQIKPYIDKEIFTYKELISYLESNIKSNTDLMALDSVFEHYIKREIYEVYDVINEIKPFFIKKFYLYLSKDNTYIAYFIDMLIRYKIVDNSIKKELINLSKNNSMYVRYKVINALVYLQDEELIVKAISNLNTNSYFIHNKTLTDVLLKFDGDNKILIKKLKRDYNSFNSEIKLGIDNYILLNKRGL